MELKNKLYVHLMEEGEIFSYSLAKGTFILPHNGFTLWESIKKHLDDKFRSLNVKNVSLPTLIPLSLLEKESNHVKGFSPELFLVNKNTIRNFHENGKDKFESEEKLVLRPTSEVLFYDWFSKKLQSYKQLPFLYNQWCQVFRAEKNTKPFLRSSEFLWQEGHTLHSNESEARFFIAKIIKIYRQYIEKILCLSVITGLKTSNEKFAGALESYTIECLLPDNQCLQLATIHYFGNNFSTIFDVKFRNKENNTEFPYSTSWGTSTRSIGALVLSHSDDYGLFFPFEIAPVQIAFIRSEENEDLKAYEYSIYKKISSKYRCKFYNQSNQTGINIKKADKDGCPIKIVIGFKEFKSNFLTVSVRNSPYEKFLIDKEEILSFIKISKKKISKHLYQKSFLTRKKNIFKVKNYKEFIDKINKKKGLFLVPFCNKEICEINVKKLFPSFSFRCISNSKKILNAVCIFCSNLSSSMSFFGRSY